MCQVAVQVLDSPPFLCIPYLDANATPEGFAPHRVPSVSIMNSIKHMHIGIIIEINNWHSKIGIIKLALLIGIIKLALYWQWMSHAHHIFPTLNKRSKNVSYPSIPTFITLPRSWSSWSFGCTQQAMCTWATDGHGTVVIWFDDFRWQRRSKQKSESRKI